MQVDRVELARALLVAAGADVREPDDLAIELRDECRAPGRPLAREHLAPHVLPRGDIELGNRLVG